MNWRLQKIAEWYKYIPILISIYKLDSEYKERVGFDIQLFRERLSQKMSTQQNRKGSMGYDQYAVPETVAVEPTFVTFL